MLPLQRIVARSLLRLLASPATDRSSREIREIQGLLENLYSHSYSRKVRRQVAAVAIKFATALLRAIELGHRVRERDELSGTGTN